MPVVNGTVIGFMQRTVCFLGGRTNPGVSPTARQWGREMPSLIPLHSGLQSPQRGTSSTGTSPISISTSAHACVCVVASHTVHCKPRLWQTYICTRSNTSSSKLHYMIDTILPQPLAFVYLSIVRQPAAPGKVLQCMYVLH